MNTNGDVINWTKEMYARFKLAYIAARLQERDTFIFDGCGYLTNYAAYLIEQLKGDLS